MNKSKWLLAIASAILVLGLAACGGNNAGGNKGGTATAPPAGAGGTVDTAKAEGVYKANCIGCHAADLSGGAGPNLQNVGGHLSAEQIAAKINAGGGGMPAYQGQLTDDEIASLATWLAEKK